MYQLRLTFYLSSQQGDDEHIDQKPRKRRHLADEEDQASPGSGSSSELSLRHSSGNGNDRPTYHLASGDGSVHRERASASAVPCSDHMNYFKKPKDKVSTDDATFSAERTSVRRPGIYIFPLHDISFPYNRGKKFPSYCFLAASFAGLFVRL